MKYFAADLQPDLVSKNVPNILTSIILFLVDSNLRSSCSFSKKVAFCLACSIILTVKIFSLFQSC